MTSVWKLEYEYKKSKREKNIKNKNERVPPLGKSIRPLGNTEGK